MKSFKNLINSWINGSKGKGPVTPEGKKSSSGNSTTHGLFAKKTPVRREDEAMHRQLREAIFAELQPEGPTEISCAEHYYDQATRLYRCLELEKDLLEWYRTYNKVKGDLSVAFAHDVSQCNCVSRLSKYAAIFERGMRKDLVELRELQANRSKRDVLCEALGQSAAEPEEGPGCYSTPAQVPAGTERETGKTPPDYLRPSDWLQRVVLSDEDPAKFQTHVQRFFAEWRPQTATKAMLVELLAVAYWRLAC